MLQKGHVLRVEFQCQQCKRRQWWASSRALGGQYLVNQKYICVAWFIVCSCNLQACACIHSPVLVFCQANTSISSRTNLGKLGAWYISCCMHFVINYQLCHFISVQKEWIFGCSEHLCQAVNDEGCC